MDTIGPWELLIVLAVVVLVFGPTRPAPADYHLPHLHAGRRVRGLGLGPVRNKQAS